MVPDPQAPFSTSFKEEPHNVVQRSDLQYFGAGLR